MDQPLCIWMRLRVACKPRDSNLAKTISVCCVLCMASIRSTLRGPLSCECSLASLSAAAVSFSSSAAISLARAYEAFSRSCSGETAQLQAGSAASGSAIACTSEIHLRVSVYASRAQEICMCNAVGHMWAATFPATCHEYLQHYTMGEDRCRRKHVSLRAHALALAALAASACATATLRSASSFASRLAASASLARACAINVDGARRVILLLLME